MALGTLAVLVPWVIFPVCDAAIATASGGLVPMKCHWAGRAAGGVGGVIFFAGLVLALLRAPGLRAGVGLMLLPLGGLLFLVPTRLIGVCPSEMMLCRLGTLPALCLLAVMTMLVGLAVFLRQKKRAGNAPAKERAGK